MEKKDTLPKELAAGFNAFSNISIVIMIMVTGVLIISSISSILNTEPRPQITSHNNVTKRYNASSSTSSAPSFRNLWKAPQINAIEENKSLITYGKELIVNTSEYLGPKGSVMQISNGLNCQNCHLAAGTTPFGNNYGGVAATYPQIRPRSGKIVDTEGRINACFQRSLNGDPLPKNSKELKAMIAYIEWLGKDVPEGKKPEGAGLYKMDYLDRAADHKKGKAIYASQCERCHGTNGEGVLNGKGNNYIYPPLWGEHSYNVSAGLYRIGKFARFIKTNMPHGVTYADVILSDEEAWDIAAYVNSQPRPIRKFKNDWMANLIDKPIDAPFGPYADVFSEKEHKYGPFKPIQKAIKALKAQE